jgi:hypothetical protein
VWIGIRYGCQTVDSDSDSSLEPLPKLKGDARETTKANKHDLEFVINYQKNLIGKMNWKKCLRIGHEKDLCKRYSSGEALRRFFNNETKKFVSFYTLRSSSSVIFNNKVNDA